MKHAACTTALIAVALGGCAKPYLAPEPAFGRTALVSGEQDGIKSTQVRILKIDDLSLGSRGSGEVIVIAAGCHTIEVAYQTGAGFGSPNQPRHGEAALRFEARSGVIYLIRAGNVGSSFYVPQGTQPSFGLFQVWIEDGAKHSRLPMTCK